MRRNPSGQYLSIAINSTAIYVISFLTVTSLVNLLRIFFALHFDIQTTITFSKVTFLTYNGDWSPDSVKAVFGCPPLLSFLGGLCILILYLKVAFEKGLLRLLLIWMFCHFMAGFFGEMMVGTLLNQGLGFVILYLHIMDTGKMITILVGLTCLFGIGYLSTRIFLFSANTYFNSLTRQNRMPFVFSQFIFPIILGNGIIDLVSIPSVSLYGILMNASIIVLFIPVILRGTRLTDMYFDDEPRTIRLAGHYLILAIILLSGLRIFLDHGILT